MVMRPTAQSGAPLLPVVVRPGTKPLAPLQTRRLRSWLPIFPTKHADVLPRSSGPAPVEFPDTFVALGACIPKGPMPSIAKVVERGICVGCGACAVATNGRVPVALKDGAYSARIQDATPEDLERASAVCPWADESLNEDALSDRFRPDAASRDPLLGFYRSVHAGRVRDPEDATQSSSGGLTNWLLLRLLELGEIDGVIHVGKTDDPLFSYSVSRSAAEVAGKRKSIYYPTSFADTLLSIEGDGLRYAFVGVPCYVTAARLLAQRSPELQYQLKYFIGLVCGHLKTQAFSELLAWQTGIPPAELAEVDFRIKRAGRPASDYAFGARRPDDDHMTTAPTRDLLGGNWGHGMFQLNACNYCDDVFAETADVVLGDAWLPQYAHDWRGTNVVVTRNERLATVLAGGVAEGVLDLEVLSVGDAVTSQAGNYRHRRVGLAVRLADDQRAGLWTPRKRVVAGYSGVSYRRLKVIRRRRALTDASHGAFRQAKRTASLQSFISEMHPLVRRYERVARPTVLRRARRLTRRLLHFG